MWQNSLAAIDGHILDGHFGQTLSFPLKGTLFEMIEGSVILSAVLHSLLVP